MTEAMELHQLQRFAARVMEQHRNDGWAGDVDGGELQDIAVACGLLEETTARGPCDPEICVCAETGDFPLTCFRDTPLMRKCYAADRNAPTEDAAR